MHRSRFALRTCAGIAALAATVMVASPAAAHVHVDSPDAAAGGFGKVVLRVPTESETASTTKVSVTLPKGTPFASVSTKTKPGWKASMETIKHDKPIKVGDANLTETVSKVTWAAQDGEGIAPEQFDEFELSVGPFPEKPGTELVFATTQTYSDGSTAAWDAPTPKSGEEPKNPAPTLTLAASSEQDTPAGTQPASTKTENTSTDMASTVALVVAVIALLGVGVALVLGGRLGRRRG